MFYHILLVEVCFAKWLKKCSWAKEGVVYSRIKDPLRVRFKG